jgi:hypothetical protein
MLEVNLTPLVGTERRWLQCRREANLTTLVAQLAQTGFTLCSTARVLSHTSASQMYRTQIFLMQYRSFLEVVLALTRVKIFRIYPKKYPDAELEKQSPY